MEVLSNDDILRMPKLIESIVNRNLYPMNLIHKCTQFGEEEIMEYMIELYIEKYIQN